MAANFRPRSARIFLVLCGALLLCLLAGCYERVTDGNQTIYRFASWLGPVIITIGVVCLPLGWFLRGWNSTWGWVLMIMGPLLVAFIAPAMYSDRVLIDDEHFEARYGAWFDPSVHNLRFQDLREIRYVGVADHRGRTKHEMHCIAKTGQATVVHSGDLVKFTVPEILARAKARGVVVVNQGP